jgi:hypothetical protein
MSPQRVRLAIILGVVLVASTLSSAAQFQNRYE